MTETVIDDADSVSADGGEALVRGISENALRHIYFAEWRTNWGQTGHWEIIVSMAFTKLSRSIQKPASATVGEPSGA
jgi:hypothetical protein